jgi:hypothetical protein
LRVTPPLLALLTALALLPTARAAVRVSTGPTPIPDGAANSPGDITIVNERLAFALAVRSPPPYGIARGAIVDVAPVRDGKIGRNCTVFADFIPNNWSAWPNTYQRVEILERGPRRVSVRAVRDFGAAQITTVYTLEAGADHIVMHTTMSNTGAAPLRELLSGFTLWPRGGFFFPVPGLAGLTAGPATGALADRAVGYDADWTVTLHAPYFDHVGFGSRDLFKLHTLPAGASESFDAWLQVGASGDLAPVLRAEIARRQLPAAHVQGAVTAREGGALAQPVVVVERQGKPYAWVLGRDGHYELTLPAGSYTLYATAREHARSAPASLELAAGAQATRDFGDLAGPGHLDVAVTDARTSRPLDARIVISEGEQPLVEFLGRRTFFTELDRQGRADLTLAPGHYVFSVSWGGGFLARAQPLGVKIDPGKTAHESVTLTPVFDPPAHGWYSADLHHHADQAEAVTPPEYLARSQLAAGLDLLFVSDHDSSVNHAALQQIADRRGRVFIPSIELSPSWGHFNAWPVREGEKLAIDTGTATAREVIAEGRRQGALILQVNHPFIAYGYFSSLAAGVAPGGFVPGFELIEINARAPDDDDKVLHALWDFWNAGHHYYLAAGTDVHDVWNDESGRVRTFAHLDEAVSASAFAEALKAGHGYVTHGPLIFPTIVFGTELKVRPGEPFALGFDLASIEGLTRADLVSGGTVIASRTFADAPREAHADFPLATDKRSWYALLVEDHAGRKAYTDPVWVDAIDYH